MAHQGVRPELREIPIGMIDEPALPSRTSMSDVKMDELVASMRALGFISTIAVTPRGDRYEVIAGHRRRIAAGRANLVAVPCLVYPSHAAGLEAIQHAENRHREELNPADEAVWFQQLLDQHPEDGTDGVAARVGESRAYVEGRLSLFQGDEAVFKALEQGRIGIGVALQLNRVTTREYRRSFLDQAMHSEATVATVSGWVAEWKSQLEPITRGVFTDTTAPIPTTPIDNSYFTCGVCGSREHPSHMVPINVHDFCVTANLKPALEMWGRRTDYHRFPRTVEEARELVNDIADRFPALLTERAS